MSEVERHLRGSGMRSLSLKKPSYRKWLKANLKKCISLGWEMLNDASHFLPQIVPSSLARIHASLEWSMKIKHIFHTLWRKPDSAGRAPWISYIFKECPVDLRGRQLCLLFSLSSPQCKLTWALSFWPHMITEEILLFLHTLQKCAVYEMLGKLQNSSQFWDGEQHNKPSILSFWSLIGWCLSIYYVPGTTLLWDFSWILPPPGSLPGYPPLPLLGSKPFPHVPKAFFVHYIAFPVLFLCLFHYLTMGSLISFASKQ